MTNSDTIHLQKFHADQSRIYKNRARFSVWRCGRRYGKTTALENIASNWGAHGDLTGWFSPTYKLLLPTYKRILQMVRPLVKSASKIDAIIELETGGAIEFWTLNDEDAGRSRKYHHVIIDEGSLVKRGLRDTWEQSIAPTLLDYGGDAIMAGTPKGVDDENFFYQACTNKKLGWKEFHAPTSANPMISREALAKLPSEVPPLVYQQEYLAEFVDWSGAMFFSLDAMLQDGEPVPYPEKIDTAYATLDSAIKTGSKNDGTGITFWGYCRFPTPHLIVLDWELIQIEGSLLEAWLPSQFARCEELAGICGARYGSQGIHIEDKASGIILIQQGVRRGWNVHAIDSKLTAVGKEERAVSISGHVHRGEVKISRYAYDKLTTYKEMTRNHFLTQVLGFKIGEKDQADDLFDTFTYGVAIGLGDSEGF
jgi:phage terminase large subunit-like protein